MRRRSHLKVLGPLLLVLAAGYGCAPAPEPEAEEATDRIEAELKDDTGVAWLSVAHENHEIRLLAPVKPVHFGTGNAEQMARQFFAKYQHHLHGTGASDELRLLEQATDPDDGTTHLVFAHYLPDSNLRVLDTTSVVDFTKEGDIRIVQPTFRSNLAAVPKVARIVESSALAKAIEAAEQKCGAPATSFSGAKTTLGVSGDETAPPALVWQVQFRYSAGTCVAPFVVVDATTGVVSSVVERAGHVLDESARGVRYYPPVNELDIKKSIDVTPDNGKWLMKSTDAPSVETQKFVTQSSSVAIATDKLGTWDSGGVKGADVDAQFNAKFALSYFDGMYARKSPDANGGAVRIIVHDPSDPDNAFFSDGDLAYHFGDGGDLSRGGKLPWSTGLDVVTHELAHGIVYSTAKLGYAGQAGAINESFCDAMGAGAEWWGKSHSYPWKKAPSRRYFGDQLFPKGGYIRDMSAGTYDSMADYPNNCRKDEDTQVCGVHALASVPNRAFSLMTVGGTHKSSGVRIVAPLGWNASLKLWYVTMVRGSMSAGATTLEEFAARQYALASTGGQQTVLCAWHAVGALSDSFLAKHNLKCNKIPEVDCSGRPDGYVCAGDYQYNVLLCKGGKKASNTWCPAPKACKSVSATDPTAVLDRSGKFVCEEPSLDSD